MFFEKKKPLVADLYDGDKLARTVSLPRRFKDHPKTISETPEFIYLHERGSKYVRVTTWNAPLPAQHDMRSGGSSIWETWG